ncbi:MAG TPA: S41 family peptidase [Flavisolibacter sp.]|nr:S41 family peptidase [Flavisolibacter sp.]
MQFVKQGLVVATLVAMIVASSCKKNDVADGLAPTPAGPPPAAGNLTDALKDSALAYSRDIYLWYNQIPASFDARSYDDLGKIMTAIRQYSTEPGFTGPVDRWSFAVKQQEWDNVSAGIAGDFGINVFFRQEGDLRVRSVEKASPAGLAGVRRGWRIVKLNGSTNITTANSNSIVEAVYGSNSTAFGFQKPDGTTVDLTLNAGTYQENPIILDSVYTVSSRKIGYFAFNSFLGDTTRVYSEFSRIFSRFASSGVNDVVIDLRYNGGGYVTMQQKLANWLAPASANGQLMMTQQFNNKYTNFNSTDYFSKLGSLNLGRIFFIVSSSTASASELLINNLKPYMNVQLVGPSKTYGKPVGYFPIEVGDWYIFPVSFRSTNKNGEGNYFNGLALNSQSADGLDKDWGDLTEASLQTVVNYITTGAYRSQSANERDAYRAQQEVSSGNRVLDASHFKGAIDLRKRK